MAGLQSPLLRLAALLVLVLPLTSRAAAPVVDHRLKVRIEPATAVLTAEDRLELPAGTTDWLLALHSGLEPKISAGDAELTETGTYGHLTSYRLQQRTAGPVTLTYSGPIRHPLETTDDGMGRLGQRSVGSIDSDNVALDGATGWYPQVLGSFQTFKLEVSLPKGWIAVSQGAGPGEDSDQGRSTWAENHPQEDIQLVAAPFKLYRSPGEGAEAQVYLRQSDDALAKQYLEATHQYIRFYSGLIGPYPYAKFALVENTWESGYGMPSFTLLGPQVLRLPFIIHTSFPHEILHNWWGNGVYVDISTGNWCEGLTNYLADYLLKERAGQGVQYRRDILKNYADYVRSGKDFPLTDFKERHGSASQAIGYGKGAMLFHMLRRGLGDDVFRQGLRRFYADNRFRRASYADIQHAFEAVSGRDLGAFFAAWTRRGGAPRLALTEVQSQKVGSSYRIRGVIEQTQNEAPFPLQVPVVVEQAEGEPAALKVRSDARRTPFELELDSAPTKLAVDPQFDVFRELADGETPVALSNLFGSDTGLILIPSDAPDALKDGYRQLAAAWTASRTGWQIQEDKEVEALPADRPIWLFGWENRSLPAFAAKAADFELDAAKGSLMIGSDSLESTDSPVLTRWHAKQPMAWLATRDAAALPALARKLPHYGKYSYLVFSGPAATNRIKGQWPSADSALTDRFD